MNTDILEGNWKQIKGSIKSSFARLTDDDVAELEGNGDQLIGRLQERYGWAQQEAAAKVNEFLEELKTN